jgi:hypothetical protein
MLFVKENRNSKVLVASNHDQGYGAKKRAICGQPFEGFGAQKSGAFFAPLFWR